MKKIAKHIAVALGFAAFIATGAPAHAFDGMEVAGIEQKAREGDADAQSKLGVMYASGIGMKQDKQEALKWYRKSAEQGNPLGEWNLAFMYVKGEGGLKTDYTEARRLFKRAAEAGLANAQYDLGIMLLDGLGGESDRAEAERWFRRAADQGNREARKILKEFPGN
ncbi:tetratricopeptide repeat protein [Geomesophilobacter sediminis]|uniref:Sel1 repeat family protein n=1 Tax=Geomesophilobacter sediminis TaxID=2798584 RepID=A0A8J7JDV2_9BACT|nr:tetratricopeptide repeat protein [Geomesophilobacter sediminis]MBJ6725481.1 sel1 repeat family protein [Geomesophilobacter sediminis]